MMDQNNPSASATPVTPTPVKSGDDNILAGQIMPDPITAAPSPMTTVTPMNSSPIMSSTTLPSAVPSAPVAPIATDSPVLSGSIGMGANALDSSPAAGSSPITEPTAVSTPLDMPVSPVAESVLTPMTSTIDPVPMADAGTGLNAYVSTQKNSQNGAGAAPVASAADPLNMNENNQPQPTTNPLAESTSPATIEPVSAPTLPPTTSTPAMDLPSAGTMSGSAPSSFVLDYNKPQSTASTADVPVAPQSELAAVIPPIADSVTVDPTDSTEVGTEMKLDLNAPTPDSATTALPGVVEMPGPAIGSQPSNVAPLEQGLENINLQKGADVTVSQPDIGLNQTITNMVNNDNQSPLSQPQAVVPEQKKKSKVFVMFSLILVVVVVALVLIMVGLNFIG